MVDKAHAADPKASDGAAPPGPPAKRSMHRHTDPREAVAEMAARAQEISQEAGSRIGKAMKDIISAAAGLAGFAVESARDLAQYMVRRGQMTQEEADKLIQEAEAAYAKRAKPAKPAATSSAAAARKPAASGAKAKPATKSAVAKKSAKPKAAKSAARASAPKKKSAATTGRAKTATKTAKKKK